jgi:hypothetical protein
MAGDIIFLMRSDQAHALPFRESARGCVRRATFETRSTGNLSVSNQKSFRTTSERWQEEDWKNRECDEDYLLNNVRIVGQVWFRGQRSCDHGLVPGLYREKTRENLHKQPGSPTRPRMRRATDSMSCLIWNTNCGLTSPAMATS